MNGHTWFFWALASAFFAALTAIFAKAGLQGIDSDFATFIRTLVILAALALFLTWAGKWQGVAAFTARNWLFLVLSGLATGASWLAYFKALQMGDASQVAPIDKLSVVLVAVFAVVFLGERPNGQTWLGIALVAAGVLVAVVTARARALASGIAFVPCQRMPWWIPGIRTYWSALAGRSPTVMVSSAAMAQASRITRSAVSTCPSKSRVTRHSEAP